MSALWRLIGFGFAMRLRRASSIIESGNGNIVSVDQQVLASGEFATFNTSQLRVNGLANMITVTQSADTSGGNLGTNTAVLNITGDNQVVNLVQSTGP